MNRPKGKRSKREFNKKTKKKCIEFIRGATTRLSEGELNDVSGGGIARRGEEPEK